VTQLARTVGVSIGIAAILFLALSTMTAFGLSRGGAEVVLPLALGLAVLVGTVGIWRWQAWGAILIAVTAVAALARGMLVSGWGPEWIAIFGAATVLELAVAIGLGRGRYRLST
jgi:hypothetical protein